MKGWIVREFGGLDVMHLEEMPIPSPAAGEVRVRIHASGMNFAETRMRSGDYSGQPLPFVAGMEMAGVVDAVGDGVSEFSVGQKVMGRARGAHAQYVCAGAAHVMPLPQGISYEEGAAIPVGWLTAWHALRTVAQPARDRKSVV